MILLYILLFILVAGLLYAAWGTYKEQGLIGAIIAIIIMAAILANT